MKKIPVTNKDGIERFALVDDEDYAQLMKYRWWLTAGYAQGRIPIGRKGMRHGVHRANPSIMMHRLILGAKTGEFGDHINMDRLDNQRSNLRIATKSQNMANATSRAGTSKYKGVHWVKTERLWRAAITVNGETIVGGKFKEEYDAAQAYNFLAAEYFGEFARFNTPLP